MKILTDFFIYFFYCHKNLVLSSLFCLALLLTRFWATMTPVYHFLAWNLFLAFLPLCIASIFIVRPHIWSKPLLRLLMLFLWLVFLPNSFYIITDMVHIRAISNAPAWFDIVLLYSFAWTGLWMGVLSIQQIELLVFPSFSRNKRTATRILLVVLTAIGIYLGRELRFNSWDILTNLDSLISSVVSLLFNPAHHAGAWSKIILHSVLIYLILQGFRSIQLARYPLHANYSTNINHKR